MDTNETPIVEINADVARSKTKNFLNRHKTKLVVAATTIGAAACFIAGRASKDVVESVDIDVNYADENPQD